MENDALKYTIFRLDNIFFGIQEANLAVFVRFLTASFDPVFGILKQVHVLSHAQKWPKIVAWPPQKPCDLAKFTCNETRLRIQMVYITEMCLWRFSSQMQFDVNIENTINIEFRESEGLSLCPLFIEKGARSSTPCGYVAVFTCR